MTDDEKAPGATPFEFRGRSRTTAVRTGEPDEPDTTDEPDAAYDAEAVPDATDGPEAPVAGDVPSGAVPSGSVPKRSGPARVGRFGWLLLAVSVLAVVVAFLSWRGADHDPDRARAALRDNAVIEGTTAVETMTSMDHRDVAAGVKAWQAVSTGVLHDQLLSIGDDEQQMLADQGKIASGRVVEAALTELTDRTATLITAVEVTVRDDESTDPAVKRNRFSADLVLVDGHWKIENLQQVAVNL